MKFKRTRILFIGNVFVTITIVLSLTSFKQIEIGHKAYKDSCWIDILCLWLLFTMPQFVWDIYRSLKMSHKTTSCLLFLNYYFFDTLFFTLRKILGGGAQAPSAPTPATGLNLKAYLHNSFFYFYLFFFLIQCNIILFVLCQDCHK